MNETVIDINKETLILSDDLIFYTIEGEGEYIGRPSVFMRMSGCNLTCRGFASPDSPNGCDSFISWSIKNKMTFAEVFKLLEDNKYIVRLEHDAIFKITGGEPLIWEGQLLKFIKAFVERYEFTPIIDFETNATLQPSEIWQDDYSATFTTSPKLKNNGDSESKTYKPDVIKWHVEHNSGFKFVVQDSDDLDEIWNKFVYPCSIPNDRIWLMPCCGSRVEHEVQSQIVAEYAKQLHVCFSPRLQLVIWDKALSV